MNDIESFMPFALIIINYTKIVYVVFLYLVSFSRENRKNDQGVFKNLIKIRLFNHGVM